VGKIWEINLAGAICILKLLQHKTTSPSSFARAYLVRWESRDRVQFLAFCAAFTTKWLSESFYCAPDCRAVTLRRIYGAVLGSHPALHHQGDTLQFPLENFQRATHHADPAYCVAGGLSRNTVTVSG
jgi:hypothetical protein